jgi:hypothetical protein
LLSFVTRPDLHPQAVKVTGYERGWELGSPGYIFLATKPYQGPGPGQEGLMIIDRRGRLVWFKPTYPKEPFDFNVQAYKGRPVLTWWQGKVEAGVGYGEGQIADGSYTTTQAVKAGDGLQEDLHELNLTQAGTALITAYQTVPADLSPLGGPRRGSILVSHAQEVDLATGRLLMDWDSLDHVGLEESFVPVPAGKSAKDPFDYFHINSIAEMPNGNLLISSRNTWALYEVDRASGKVLWRINGKKSDFSMGPGSRFYWQHHARMFSGGKLTVFDDGSSPPEEKQSRGLVLSVDTKSMHVSLEHAYLHPAGFIAANQGSVQLLDDGRVFVGWGNQPYFSEFAPGGNILMDGQLPFNIQSYRAFTHDWAGRPAEPPAVVAKANPAGGALVYASWNGATDVDHWNVLAGQDASTLSAVGTERATGFETAVAVNSTGPHFSVVALDVAGKELGRSPVVALSEAGAGA